MFPLILVIILNTLMAFAHELSKPLKKHLTKPAKKTEAEESLEKQIAILEEELSKINCSSEYTNYIKKIRQIQLLKRKLSSCATNLFRVQLMNEAINIGLGYVFQFLGSIILLIVSIYYRYTPVIVFDEKFNFSPFGTMIGFPTGIDNAISVPFWIFITNFTFRCVASLFRV